MLTNKLNDILNTTDTKDIAHIICKFMKDHIEELPSLSIDEMAAGCYVSKSMISKFIKQLGYENYKEFKYDCEIRIDAFHHERPFLLFQGRYEQQLLQGVANMSECLQQAFKEIDYSSFYELVDDILHCDCLIALGHGSSKLHCELLQYYLDYLKIPVMVADVDMERVHPMEENTLLILISAGGRLFEYNHRLLKRVLALKQKKWLLTCNPSISCMEHRVVVANEHPEMQDLLMVSLLKLIVSECNYEREVHKI